MARYQASLSLLIILTISIASGSGAAQTQVLGAFRGDAAGCVLVWLVRQRHSVHRPVL
jgi:hypothetical protein